MTLVLSCLTSDYVVLVADRRLVVPQPPPDAPRITDEDACKLVFLERQFAFAYSGLANMETPPAGRTDFWLAATLQKLANSADSVPALFDGLAREVVRTFDRMTRTSHFDARAEPHSFVAVGFQGGESALAPVFLSLSNVQDPEGRRRPPGDWVLRPERLGDGPILLHETGQSLAPDARDQLLQVLPEIAHDNPAGVVDYLAQAIREESRRGNTTVGESLLVALVPKRGVREVGGITILGLDQLASTPVGKLRDPVAIDWPAGARDWVLSAPHVVRKGGIAASIHMWDRELTPEEVARRCAEGRARMPTEQHLPGPGDR